MFAACVELRNAEKVKQYLIKKELVHPEYLPVKELGFLYFPLLKKGNIPLAKVVSPLFSFPQKQRKATVEELLRGTLTKQELSLLPRTQEIVGSILILEIPSELEKHETAIAKAYLTLNKHLATVVKKARMHSGQYRTRTVRILAGKRSKETVHHENGVKIKLHLEKTYFSARLANERLRIARQVKEGEQILVMFSGAGPYPLVLARHSPAEKIVGVELNPLAHQYALENIALNNLQEKITLHEGDVHTILPLLTQKFDRILLPLPKTGDAFLSLALSKARSKALVHLYAFLDENDIKRYTLNMKKLSGNRVRMVRIVKCGQFSPGTYRVCFDLKVEK